MTVAENLIGKDQSLKLEVKERPDVGVFVKVGKKDGKKDADIQ